MLTWHEAPEEVGASVDQRHAWILIRMWFISIYLAHKSSLNLPKVWLMIRIILTSCARVCNNSIASYSTTRLRKCCSQPEYSLERSSLPSALIRIIQVRQNGKTVSRPGWIQTGGPQASKETSECRESTMLWFSLVSLSGFCTCTISWNIVFKLWVETDHF